MISELYDKIAEKYDQDVFGIFESTRALVSAQLQKFLPKKIDNAVDFAIGTGSIFLDLMKHKDMLKMYGNDISPKMLEIAKKKLGSKLEVFCDDLANIHNHLKDGSQDLVLCHYVFSYCNLEKSMASAARVLRPGGYCSITTTTKRNFSELFTDRFPVTARILNVSQWLERVSTPANHEDLIKRVSSFGFETIDQQRLRKAVSFESYKDVKSWAYDSGWVASYFETYTYLKYFLTRIYFALSRIIYFPLYPVKASTDISVVLVRKI